MAGCTIVHISTIVHFMRSTESQQRQQSDRRQLILDTTLRLIAAGGIDSVTHRKVADAAGIPLGSTTYYFDSREHLLGEAFEYYITMAMALHESLISGPINSSHELVDFLVELTERELDDEPLLLAEYEMTLFAARNERIAGLLHEWDSVMIANIVAALTGLGAKRPEDAGRTILHCIRGYELDRLSRHAADPEGFRRRIENVVAAFIR